MDEGGQIYIVKRHGHHGLNQTEVYDSDKLHRSIVTACVTCGVPSGHAESIARRITEEVTEWLQNRPEVTSDDLRHKAGHYLKTHHPDAAYLYEHHRSTL